MSLKPEDLQRFDNKEINRELADMGVGSKTLHISCGPNPDVNWHQSVSLGLTKLISVASDFNAVVLVNLVGSSQHSIYLAEVIKKFSEVLDISQV